MKTENNKIIAEFMGLELEETLSDKMVYARLEFNNPNKQNDCQTEFYEEHELLYHFNWNWLIEVIEKCRECQIFGSQRLIDNINNRLMQLDLLATYNNVVDFIEWHNQNKPKQYPFNEGDDYWVIEDNKPVLSCWDYMSEEVHDENPNKIYYKSEEDAHEALLNS